MLTLSPSALPTCASNSVSRDSPKSLSCPTPYISSA